ASFELVLATDIIEHVNEDADALREIWRVLAPGGRVLITVPAFESLWGLQDERSAHVRRYRMKPLLQRVESSGLEPLTHYYFNYLLFVPIWLARRAIDLFKVNLDSENEVNSPALNRLLSAIFRLDVSTARLVRPPFGVSALVVAKKAVHR
nr:class I SAM-dependent methyltransferase [Gammaproteobacteria bacterium]